MFAGHVTSYYFVIIINQYQSIMG